MRILKTTQTYYPYLSKGGPPLKVRGIARGLARRGHEVTVLTADLGEANDGAAGRKWQDERTKSEWGWEWQEESVKAIYLKTLANYRATTISPRVWEYCRRQLSDFELVHVYGLYELVGAVVARFCRRRGIPYIVEPLGMFGPKVRSLRKKRIYHSLIGDSLLNGAAAVIATSETESEELAAGGIPREKITLRRNGLDLVEFRALPKRGAARTKLGIGESEQLVLFIGRLSYIKGLDFLVRAFAEIAKTNSGARLLIVGPDDGDGCREELLELVARLDLTRSITFTGPLYGAEKLEALAVADFFVLPSQYESFGNAAAEAIACDLPVLVTRGCGIAPLIHERAGLVVDCSVEGLKAGMLKMLDGPSAMNWRTGCAAVARGLSWDEPVEQMEMIYSSVLGSLEYGLMRTDAVSTTAR
jgi:glycosyltransferase involved in cell wall biosynthesis